ncbi:hypothetical protein BVI434_1730014 [Burkholderia vietnamiensis]|nr:hypothetical protein BVI434_1730014 [Burkholderia vietnamiensis]
MVTRARPADFRHDAAKPFSLSRGTAEMPFSHSRPPEGRGWQCGKRTRGSGPKKRLL